VNVRSPSASGSGAETYTMYRKTKKVELEGFTF
jgi:hypothetical protein